MNGTSDASNGGFGLLLFGHLVKRAGDKSMYLPRHLLTYLKKSPTGPSLASRPAEYFRCVRVEKGTSKSR